MHTEIWKYVNLTTAKSKHLFLSDKARRPVCRIRTGATWNDLPERLSQLPECRLCLRKKKQFFSPNDLSDYTWKYVSGFDSKVIHAFGKEAIIPLCGINPLEYNSYWEDDPAEVAKRNKCGNCQKADIIK
jgi:hypothetical protein